MYALSYRSHTVHETKLLKKDQSPDLHGLVRLALKPTLTLVIFFIAGGWAAELIVASRGYDIRWWGRGVGAGLGLVVGVPLFIRFLTGDRYIRRAAKQQLANRSVQEIEVRPLAVYAVAVEDSTEPCLCFEVEDQVMLVLWGRWLKDTDNYELDGFSEKYADHWNGLAEPYAFPCNHFTIGRSAVNGMVLSLQPQGTYIHPKRASFTLRDSSRLKECDFFNFRREGDRIIIDDTAFFDPAKLNGAAKPPSNRSDALVPVGSSAAGHAQETEAEVDVSVFAGSSSLRSAIDVDGEAPTGVSERPRDQSRETMAYEAMDLPSDSMTGPMAPLHDDERRRD